MVSQKDKRGVIKSAIGKVTNAVGTAMAYPSILAANRAGKQADKDVSALKAIRGWPKNHRGAFLDSKGKPTEFGKAFTAAEEVRFRYRNKNK